MSTAQDDGYARFRRLAQRLHADGFLKQAARLEETLSVAWTSSSELLAELGMDLVAVRTALDGQLSKPTRDDLQQCLEAVQRVWPHIR